MLNLDFVMKMIDRIYANDRFFSYDSMFRTCAEVEKIMQHIGLTGIHTFRYPADGKISHGGWVMPAAWKPKTAKLEVLLPDGSWKTICSYPEVPCSLMLYSTGCDVTGKLVMYSPDADVKDKFVLGGNHFFSIQIGEKLYRKGARILLSDKLLGPFAQKKEYECLNDSCQWCNYSLPFWPEKEPRGGFSLSPNQSLFLQNLLEEQGEVTLHASIDAAMTEGTIPMVTGFLPGETDEEIVITGHLFEEGADDNASGCALALAIAQEMVKRPHKRGIRLFLTHEVKSLQAYLNTESAIPKIVAGIDLDMVGVTTDNQIDMGDSTPVFPNYAPALLYHLMKQYGFQPVICEITSMDTQFSDPEYQAPMTFMDMFSAVDYHKSTDTPDTISREVLERSGQVALQYVDLLVNAGEGDVPQLAEYVLEYETMRSEILRESGKSLRTGYASPAFAMQTARSRLDSIVSLVEPEKRAAARSILSDFYFRTDRLFQFSDPQERPVLSAEQHRCLNSMTPVKKFHGTLSFEKYMMQADNYPKIRKLLSGWSTVPWLDYALMWSDGTRSLAVIWNMLVQSGNPADPDLFYEIMLFLADRKLIDMKK